MNGGDGEVSLAQAIADVAAREQQLVVCRAASIDHRIGNSAAGEQQLIERPSCAMPALCRRYVLIAR